MTRLDASRELEPVPVRVAVRAEFSARPWRDPARADGELGVLASLVQAAAGSDDGDRMIGRLEDAAVRASGGRWTHAEMSGWTVATLVSLLAEQLGPGAAIQELREILEGSRKTPDTGL